MNQLVSVVMPVYNCENYIESAMRSVLGQTYTSLELIVVNDCSSDRTLDIVKRIQTEDTRVVLLENIQNLGVSASRNIAISYARGEWIAFLDGDDLWEKDKLQRQLHHANKTDAQFVFTGAAYINEQGQHFKGIFEVPEQVSYKALLRQNIISCSSVLVKKHFFSNIKMENDRIHEDYAVWLRILKTGTIAFGMNEPLLIYRISQNSKSGNKLKTIRMTYGVFRFIGINPFSSFYFMVRHVVGAVRKYRRVFAG